MILFYFIIAGNEQNWRANQILSARNLQLSDSVVVKNTYVGRF
jgi:hypothetical protein